MADKIRYAISVTPVEEIADEQSNTHEVISGEVGKSLGGNGEAVVADYSGDGSASKQGYLNAIVNYLEAPDGVDGEYQISDETTASFVFIKNTGYVFDSVTVLGVPETSRLLKVTANSGAIILAVLKAGEPFIMKALQSTGTIDASGIKVETVNPDGSEAAGGVHLAVEYLVVD